MVATTTPSATLVVVPTVGWASTTEIDPAIRTTRPNAPAPGAALTTSAVSTPSVARVGQALATAAAVPWLAVTVPVTGWGVVPVGSTRSGLAAVPVSTSERSKRTGEGGPTAPSCRASGRGPGRC